MIVRYVLTFLGKLCIGFVVLSVLGVVMFKFLPVWVTPLMVARKIEAVKAGEESRIYKSWTSYDQISKEMALAVVASEDQNFPKHWGFDFTQIKNALASDKKRKRGASTITQQVAKNVFLWQGRSYFRKGLEAWFTLWIELLWSKERILEVYLNVAETGKMTFGAEAASQRFYKKPAKALNRHEAARIAAVLPNPKQFSVRNPSAYTQKRTAQIVQQMRNLGGQQYIAEL